jgi:ATP-dependent transcriptional regulator
MHENEPALKVLKRERVDEKLQGLFQHPITIVTAPIGYGKTTAVRTCLGNCQLPCIWTTMFESVMITASENFWYLLIKEFYKHLPNIASALEERGFPTDSIQISRMIEVIKDFEVTQDVVLIIDDYHLIENDQINLFLKRLAFAKISWLHIVIISRGVPQLDIEELTFKGICLFIQPSDLSFTEDEIQLYFDLIKFQADDHIKQKICSDSSGWIAVVYLMVTNFTQNYKLEYHNSIYKMLKTSFFDKYDDDIKILLFRLSLFSMVTVEQAVYILEDTRVVGKLEQLYRENAFISLDNQGNYKFHQIFLDFLHKEKAGWDLDMQREIHRAGEWYSSQGDHANAFKYWYMANDYENIFKELELADITSINSIDTDMLFKIFNSATDEQKYKYPMATLKYIFFVILDIDKQLGTQMLAEMEQYFLTHSHYKYSRSRILAEININYTTMAFNNAEEIKKYADKALELLGEEHSMTRNQKGVLTYSSAHFTYAYYSRKGQYKKTVETLLTAFESYIKVTNGSGMGCDYISRAEYALETGNLDQVELNAIKAIYKANTCKQLCIALCAKLTLARLYILQNRKSDLQTILDELNIMEKMEKNAINLYVIDNALGYIYACLNQYDNIPQWLRSNNIEHNSVFKRIAFNYIVNGKAILLSGNYIELEILTERFTDYFREFQFLLGIIHNHIYNAAAKYQLYGLNSGAEELQKAIDIAAEDGIIMPFVENTRFILPILKSGLLKVNQEFLDHILSFNYDINNKDGFKAAERTTLLSAREIEVLNLMENGENQSSIADKLFISEHTVKRHIQNIYQKLDVNNKTLAIKKYRGM